MIQIIPVSLPERLQETLGQLKVNRVPSDNRGCEAVPLRHLKGVALS
jgi:hypothetical protein